MPPSIPEQLRARDPRLTASFPLIPVDNALGEWRRLATTSATLTPSSPAPAQEASSSSDPDHSGPICELATHLWRARHRLNDNATPGDANRRAVRHIDSATDTLRQLDVTLKDWLNEPYDPGLPLKVLTFQPTPGISRDTVVEVLRPAILWQGRLLQSGEVVVGTPLPQTSANPVPVSA